MARAASGDDTNMFAEYCTLRQQIVEVKVPKHFGTIESLRDDINKHYVNQPRHLVAFSMDIIPKDTIHKLINQINAVSGMTEVAEIWDAFIEDGKLYARVYFGLFYQYTHFLNNINVNDWIITQSYDINYNLIGLYFIRKNKE